MSTEGTKRRREGTGLSENEERLQEIFSQVRVGIAQIGLDGAWLAVNNRYCEMLGYSEAELREKTLQDTTHPDDWNRTLDARRQLLAGEISSHVMEKRYIRKDGTFFWGRLHRSLPRDRDNRPKYIIAVVEDITEKMQAESALRDSEQRFTLAQSAAHMAAWDRDLSTNVITFSGEYASIYGFAADQRALTYEEWLRLIHPEDREKVREHDRDTLMRTHNWDDEFRVVWPDGSVHWLLGKGTVFRDEAGQPVRIVGVNIEITNHMYMEGALRQSEERFRLAVQATNDAVWDIDLMTGTVSWNETYATIYGRPPETSKSWQWWIDRIHPEDRERTSGGLRSAISGSESTWTCEYRFQRVDGAWAYLYDRAYIARDPSGRAWRVIGAMQDLTQRKRAEAELRESEERFRNIADSAPVMVWVCDSDAAVTFTNRFGLNFFGRTMEQIQRMGWTDLLYPDDSERVASEFSAARASRRMYQISFRVRRADGEYRWVLAQGAPRFAGDVYVGHIGITTDITELKQSQEQLQAAQKLESLGVLAGGIAHDFNNLLGGIHSVAELVEMDLAVGSASREEIQKIKTAAIRGSEIVRELMIYAGENQQDLNEAVDVSRLVEEMLQLLKVSVSKQVALRTDFGGDLRPVWGDAPQIRQVVMNLVLNASEAIGDTKGAITVTAAQVSGGRDLAPNNATDLIPGDYVRIEVSDTGCGMTEETKAKIFDPFFSTKFPGRGLGLAVVQGIVRDLGGAINIVSAPGQGTTFQVLLPCAPKGGFGDA